MDRQDRAQCSYQLIIYKTIKVNYANMKNYIKDNINQIKIAYMIAILNKYGKNSSF